jgi:hypothetical protein
MVIGMGMGMGTRQAGRQAKRDGEKSEGIMDCFSWTMDRTYGFV